MKKQISTFNGKKVYLLGCDKEGVYYWLVEPRWDCGWYWGFGYIQTYTNNKNPERAWDIMSHQHATKFYPKWWGRKDDSILKETTFSTREGWELAELFRRFYLFQDLAGLYHVGHCGTTTIKDMDMKDHQEWERINKKIILPIMDRILKILTPND